jgi:hypothetical protein
MAWFFGLLCAEQKPLSRRGFDDYSKIRQLRALGQSEQLGRALWLS